MSLKVVVEAEVEVLRVGRFFHLQQRVEKVRLSLLQQEVERRAGSEAGHYFRQPVALPRRRRRCPFPPD